MIVEKLNFSVPINELIDYYNTLVKEYDYLDWSWNKCSQDIVKQWRDAAYKDPANLLTHGWAIQSNLKDINKPCPPWNISTLETTDYRNTKLAFGPIQRLQEKMPYSYRWSVSVQPPGGKVSKHSDDEKDLTVWIPIYNKGACIVFDREYNLKADGSAYLLDTTNPHYTENNSDETRVTIICRIKKQHKKDIINLQGPI